MRKLLLTLLLLATPLHAQIQCEALVASQGTCPTGTNCTVKGSALSVDQADAIVRNTARLCLRAAAATDTLASNPELGPNETMFSTDGATGGLLFEGSVADASEGLFLFPDVTGSDQTFTLLTDSTAFAGDVTGTSGATVVSEAGVTQHQGAIDHDALINFVAAEHVAAVVVNNNEYCQGGPSTTFDCDVTTIPEADIDALLHRDAEIKDGDLVSFDDANGDFVATDVDSALEELVSVNGSGPNAVDGKVEWSQLAGVPAGFADGTDDGGDEVTVNTVSVDTTVDLTDSASLDWTLTDGGAGGPDTVTGNVAGIDLDGDQVLDIAGISGTQIDFYPNDDGSPEASIVSDGATVSSLVLWPDDGNTGMIYAGGSDWELEVANGGHIKLRNELLTEFRGLKVLFYTIRVDAPQTATCTDEGTGANATLTITPTTSNVQVTQNDTNGCDVTMSESGAANGQVVTLTVVANTGGTVNLSDTPGVTELAGAFAMDVWDSIDLIYQVDRWVEKTRSNN